MSLTEDVVGDLDPTMVERLANVFEGEDLKAILNVYSEVEALTEKTNLNEELLSQVIAQYNQLQAKVRQLEDRNASSKTSGQLSGYSGSRSQRNDERATGSQSKLKADMLKEVDDAVSVLCNELLLLQSTIEAHKMQNSRDRETYEKRIVDLQVKITEKKHRMRTDGKYIWRINDYDRTLRTQSTTNDVEHMSLVSPHFQAPSGHEFRLRVFLNGTGKGKGKFLSMFIQCYKTEYDEILDYPFNAVIVFRVYDQNPRSEKKHHKLMFRTNNSQCFQRPDPSVDYTPENGLAQLLSHDLIKRSADPANQTADSPRYLVDDTIFVGCEIVPGS